MLATKNRAGGGTGLILAMFVFLTACAPPGPRALFKGKNLLEAGKCEAAVQELRTATSLMPTNASAWNYLGLAYHRTGQLTNAALAYSRAFSLNRDLLEARFNLGCLWLEQNKFEAAKSEFTAYTLRRSQVVAGWLKLGLVYLGTTNSAAAERTFREATNLDPKSAEAFNGLGLAQLQRGRVREAAESFNTALTLQPDYGPALLNLATMSHSSLNNRAEALRRYREYLALRPRGADWQAVNTLVQALTQPTLVQARPVTELSTRVAAASNRLELPITTSGRPSPAPKVETNQTPARSAVIPKFVSGPAPASATTAKPPVEAVAKNAGDVVQTSPASSVKVTTTNPAAEHKSKVESQEVLAHLNPLKRDARPSAEEKTVTNLIALAGGPAAMPDIRSNSGGRFSYQPPATPVTGDRLSAERVLSAGLQAQNIGRVAEAIQAYRRATQLDGSYFEAYYRLGLAALEIRSFRLALSAWETAVSLRPDSADARYNFALTLKAANYPQDAAKELENLLALHPDEARGHLTLGNLYAEQLRDPGRARQHYAKVLQLDPRNPQAQSIRYWLVANPG